MGGDKQGQRGVPRLVAAVPLMCLHQEVPCEQGDAGEGSEQDYPSAPCTESVHGQDGNRPEDDPTQKGISHGEYYDNIH